MVYSNKLYYSDTRMYFKITNKDENHNGFQYQDGLNVLIEKFNDNPDASCCKGGFYFADAANIVKFLGYGIYLREVSLPTDNKDFKMLKDKDGDKWRSNMIIFGKRHDLSNVDTFKYLMECGADIHANEDIALRLSAKNGCLDVIKFLIDNNADIHAVDDLALKWSAQNGHLDVVKFLVEHDANIHADYDCALRRSAENGYLDVVKFLVEMSADIHADDDCALRRSAENGHSDMVQFLVTHGAKIDAGDNYALKWSTREGHANIADYLTSMGAKI